METVQELTHSEAIKLLQSRAIEIGVKHGVCFGNYRFYTMPKGFELGKVEKHPTDEISVWGNDENGNVTIRHWTKW